jgi:hypothetical protein
MVEAEATITLAKDSADILLAPGGNLVQNLFVEESALAASAKFKDTVRDTFIDGPKRLRESLPFGSFLPPLPFEGRFAPFVQKTEKELKAQQLADKIASVVDRESNNNGVSRETSSSAVVLNSLRSLDAEQAALVLKVCTFLEFVYYFVTSNKGVVG